MKPLRHQLRFALLSATLALFAGCAAPTVGPAPRPNVVCNLSCSEPTTLGYGAVLELRLIDFTKPDTRPIVLAERVESNPGQPPLRYRLLFNATAIDPAHDYGVEARILFKGRPVWVQPEPVPVITKDHPYEVDIVLQPGS